MDISAMDPQSIQQLFDAEVVGPEGEAIGTVEQIFADDVTGAPTFVTVKDARTGAESFLPVSGADYNGRRVEVPFSQDVVQAAPSANGGEDLSPEREAEVYGYYGIRAPRRSRQEEAEPDDSWGEDAEFTPAQEPSGETQSDEAEGDDVASDEQDEAATDEPGDPDEAVTDEPGDPDEAAPAVVPEDATAQTVLGQDEPQFEPTEEAEDPATEFRSDVEIDEETDPAVPDEASADENPAEETAVLAGGSFPGAATSAGLVTAGSAAAAGSELDRSDDAIATGDPDAVLDADDEGLAAGTEVDDAALSTDRLDGESPEAAREDEAESPDDEADSDEPDEDEAGGDASEADDQSESDGRSAASAIPGLPAGATLRKYVVTEMVTVQVPVRREVVCWVDAEGGVHELEAVEAPEATQKKDLHDPATWWFGSEAASETGDDKGPEHEEGPES